MDKPKHQQSLGGAAGKRTVDAATDPESTSRGPDLASPKLPVGLAHLDLEQYPNCGCDLKIIAAILEQPGIEKILKLQNIDRTVASFEKALQALLQASTAAAESGAANGVGATRAGLLCAPPRWLTE